MYEFSPSNPQKKDHRRMRKDFVDVVELVEGA